MVSQQNCLKHLPVKEQKLCIEIILSSISVLDVRKGALLEAQTETLPGPGPVTGSILQFDT